MASLKFTSMVLSVSTLTDETWGAIKSPVLAVRPLLAKEIISDTNWSISD